MLKMMLLQPNLGKNAIAVFKLCSLLFIMIHDTYINLLNHIFLTQTNNTLPCPNEKLNI